MATPMLPSSTPAMLPSPHLYVPRLRTCSHTHTNLHWHCIHSSRTPPAQHASSSPHARNTTLLTPSLTLTADFVQELYLKELKAYKTPVVKDSDAQGHVLAFNQPKTPKSPEETELASSLKEYESMAVEVEGQEGAAVGVAPVVVDWLVDEEEDDEHAHGH